MEGKNKIPYNYSEIMIRNFESAKECTLFEIELHKKFNKHKYKPLIEFGGMYECYNIEALVMIKEDLDGY